MDWIAPSLGTTVPGRLGTDMNNTVRYGRRHDQNHLTVRLPHHSLTTRATNAATSDP